ncbi:MAG: hypothetical protein KME31_16245 [Tolypothrix carrinoi HA7290-LM1]|nr:hypothetical protein [Tolypothrix carrinoi HA7290-LM1]
MGETPKTALAHHSPLPPSGFASRSWGRPPRPRWLTIPHSPLPIPHSLV